VLEAVFILLEFPSPSRIIFIDSHSPPLSGSPYRSFRSECELIKILLEGDSSSSEMNSAENLKSLLLKLLEFAKTT
jgi:hypothetical protein